MKKCIVSITIASLFLSSIAHAAMPSVHPDAAPISIHDYGDIYRRGFISNFTPVLSDNPTKVSFSNDITFDTRFGEPDLPSNLKINSYEGTGYYLVQVIGSVIDSWKEEIAAVGASIVGYIPNYTLIVRADESIMETIRNISFIRWTGIFHPAYKMPKELFTAQGDARIVIQIFPDEDAHAIAQAIVDIGFSVENVIDHPLTKSVDATGDLSRVEEIARIAGVLWIQLWAPVELDNNNSQWVVQTGWRDAVPGPEGWRIWNEGIRGQGLVLGISDSGVRPTHLMFYDAAYPINDAGIFANHRKIVAYKLYGAAEFGDTPNFFDYHGTFQSGTVAGNDSVNGGGSPYDGEAKDARLYFLDFCDNAGNYYIGQNLTPVYDSVYPGHGLPYNILQHSGSWGWPNPSGTYKIEDASTDAYCWEHKDFLTICPAGNQGPTAQRIYNPGIAKNVITLGATQNGIMSNQIVNNSSRGPTQDNRIKPTIMAPSLRYSAHGIGDDTYRLGTGTSNPTASTNGTVGLIRQYFLTGFYPTGAANPIDSIKYPSSALLRSMAIVSADPNVGSYTIPDFNIGWGRIDLDSVLYFTGDLRKLIILDDTIGISTGQAISDSFHVVSQIPLRVCMAWTDTAAAPNANPTLVNDLNLELIAPNGTTYRGNQYSGGQSVPNPGTWDDVNVEECCRIDDPQTGTWQIVVNGQQVVFGPQPFAFAITGDIEPAVGVAEETEITRHDLRTHCRLISTVTSGIIALEVFLPGECKFEVNAYDVGGRWVANIFADELPGGREVMKVKTKLPSGVYFLRLKAGNYNTTEKLLLIR